MDNRKGEGELWKGLVAGVAGGIVASWTMNQFQSACGVQKVPTLDNESADYSLEELMR
jgi:hypothetical protein